MLSHVDGERGELIIAGERVADLVRKTGFEAVTARLWSGATGQPIGEATVRAALGEARQRAFARLPALLGVTRGLSIVDGFRAAIAGLRAENGLPHEATIVGAFPVIAGALVQRAQGSEPVAPDPTASHAADTLSMMLDRKPDAARGGGTRRLSGHRLRSRHERIDLRDAGGGLDPGRPVRGGHGGVLRADRTAAWRRAGAGAGNARCHRQPRERIKPWVDGALARGERLMGFGHRIYRVRDPRADVLKDAIERLAGGGTDLPFAGEVEAYIRAALRRKNPDRPLDTNVEFFTAILLDALKIPRQAFTPIFAVARAAGWTAHAREQQRGGRLIRPSSAYIGPMPE